MAYYIPCAAMELETEVLIMLLALLELCDLEKRDPCENLGGNQGGLNMFEPPKRLARKKRIIQWI
jgi:hypothetical protein